MSDTCKVLQTVVFVYRLSFFSFCNSLHPWCNKLPTYYTQYFPPLRFQGLVLWLDCHSRRYLASRSENVLGTVLSKQGDGFRVDIGAAEPAWLSYLAFEGATKKNRPNVNVGDVVYAKLLVASRWAEGIG